MPALAKRPKPPSQAEEALRVENWNLKHPTGTRVIVRLDDGSTTETTTRSQAWLMGGHTAVINLTGQSGGYMLSRVTPAQS